jgi:hypothetical protein
MALGERSREQGKEERRVGARDVSASPVPGMFLYSQLYKNSNSNSRRE